MADAPIVNFCGPEIPPEEYCWYLDATVVPDQPPLESDSLVRAAAGANPPTGAATSATSPSAATPSGTVEAKWTLLARFDALALERAVRAPLGVGKVPIRGDILDADVPARIAEPVYWTAPKQRLLRAAWFSEESKNIFVPIEEDVAGEIERAFLQKVWTKATPEQPYRLTIEAKALIVLFYSEQSIRVLRTQLSTRIYSSMTSERSASIPLRRGASAVYAQATIPPQQSTSFRHLIFVIHGIGQRLDFNDISTEASWMRTMLNTHGPLLQPTRFNDECVQILPLQWRKGLKLPCDSTGSPEVTIDDITVPQIGNLREALNGTMVDVLMFLVPQLRHIILSAAAAEFNRIWELFVTRNPRFVQDGGQVHFLAHSLGSVVAFELLSPALGLSQPPSLSESDSDEIRRLEAQLQRLRYEQNQAQCKLNFNVNTVFAIGSPLAVFLCVRGVRLSDQPGPENVFPACRKWYNIYNGYDPVAYRLEPLLAKHLSKSRAKYVPWHKGGGEKLHIQAQALGEAVKTKIAAVKSAVSVTKLWGSLSAVAASAAATGPSVLFSATSSTTTTTTTTTTTVVTVEEGTGPVDAERARRLLAKLGDGAVDYVLQDDALDAPYVVALLAHFSYWSSLDVGYFIINKIYEIVS